MTEFPKLSSKRRRSGAGLSLADLSHRLHLRFPFSRPELLKEWVLNIGRGDFEPKQHTVICSEHFRPECFSAFGNRKNLKHNAVPTVFAFQDPTQVGTRRWPPLVCSDPACLGSSSSWEWRQHL